MTTHMAPFPRIAHRSFSLVSFRKILNGSNALTDTHPRHRYRVGIDARTLFVLMSKLPTFLTDTLYLLQERTRPLPAAIKARRQKAAL